MLHELLLSLSGQPSPLLDKTSELSESLRSIVSPAELALLESLAVDLGEKHQSIRHNTSNISSSHPSTVCRAVASAILSLHLAAFQQRILEVERDILKDDASLVGAYNIVPLSAVVGSFEGWGRKLAWLQDLVQYVQSPTPNSTISGDNRQRACTAAMLIDRLRDAMLTGYPDIQETSLSLVKVAETAWLRQLSAWVLYGRHPGEDDFFVQSRGKDGEALREKATMQITESLLPPFVTANAANSALFIGKSLNHIRERQRPEMKATTSSSTPELALLPAHLAQLSALQSPISSAGFSAAINAIRLSLSQNALQKLLPISKVMDLLYTLKDFFLLERGEFAIALITSADDRLNTTNRRDKLPSRIASTLADSLASMTIKEGEVHAVLARTWTALASFQNDQDDEDIDVELDHARDLIRLSINSIDSSSALNRDASKEKLAVFDDLLLPSPTTLSIKVPSPLDLFLTAEDTEAYSLIHAYLIAIRRAHLRLSKLFLLSKLRRDYPCPRPPLHLPHKDQLRALEQKRRLSNNRTKTLRPAWATIGSATLFFAELSSYLQGEVIQRSWSAFHSWLLPEIPTTDRPTSSSSNNPSRPSSSRLKNLPLHTPTPHDPETLTHAHKRFLNQLTSSLLLTQPTFTHPLRRLLTSIDHITALLHRLSTLWTNTDTLSPSDPSLSNPGEESALIADLHEALPSIGRGVKNLVEVLRQVDEVRGLKDPVNSGGDRGDRAGEGVKGNGWTSGEGGEHAFEPWVSRSLDRLLLKFDFGDVDDFLGGKVEGL